MNITVIGAGYVGLVQAVGLAEAGHTVRCVEKQTERVAQLKEAKVPFFEPGVEELIKANSDAGRLRFFSSLQESTQDFETDCVFVCVQTPSNEDGSCDVSAVEAVVKELAAEKIQALVVIKSTVPPGMLAQIKQWTEGAVRLAYNPEFLREGRAVEDFFAPDRVVIGVENEEDAATLRRVYEFVKAPVYSMSFASAQLTKYAANTMLAMRLSLMNELAVIADAVEADIQDVEKGIGSDPRIGEKFLRAGAGFGGSCFPKDVQALASIARDFQIESLLIDPIIEANNRQTRYFVEKAERILQSLEGKKCAVWGLAFNANTDDVRESPAIKICKQLIEKGATITAYDPRAMESAKKELNGKITFAQSKEEAANGADVLFVLTEWDEFAQADWQELAKSLASTHVFDGKNVLPRATIKAAGLHLHGMGLCER